MVMRGVSMHLVLSTKLNALRATTFAFLKWRLTGSQKVIFLNGSTLYKSNSIQGDQSVTVRRGCQRLPSTSTCTSGEIATVWQYKDCEIACSNNLLSACNGGLEMAELFREENPVDGNLTSFNWKLWIHRFLLTWNIDRHLSLFQLWNASRWRLVRWSHRPRCFEKPLAVSSVRPEG